MKRSLFAPLLACALFCVHESLAQNSLLASEDWVTDSPSGSIFRKISVQTDPSDNVYVAGHLLNGSGNHDIIIQKLDNTGALLWEETYDGPGSGEDFAAALFVDGSGNVYVTGATTVSPTVGFSIVALKFKGGGAFEWAYVYNNGSINSPLAGGTAIYDDGTYTYVTGSCFGSTTSADFVTIKLDTDDGSEVWSTKRDKNNLRDFPVAIQVRPTTVTARGVAEVSPGAFMSAGATHDKTTGVDTGMDVAGDTVAGINDIFDVVTDADGNTFMAGTTYSPTSGYDWLMLWIAPGEVENLRITETSSGNADDRALAVLMDIDGNFYVAGYFTVAGEGKNIGLAKYTTAGDLLWKRTYNGEANTDDIALRMSPNPNGMGGVFLTGYVHNGAYSDYVTIGYDANGTVMFQKEFDSPFGLDDIPTDMIADGNSLTVVGNCKNTLGQFKPYIVNYRIQQRNLDLALDTVGDPMFARNEMIVRFHPHVVNTSFVNSPKTIINLAELVPPSVIEDMSDKTGYNFDDDNRGDIWAQKIFVDLDTTDTISISRTGNRIQMPTLWSAFVIHLAADDSTLSGITDSLNLLPEIIQYSHLNFVGEPLAVPNDDYYGEQIGLKDNADDPGGIGIESAWDIQKGEDKVEIGFYDFEMDWAHPDFGDGTYNGSVVKGWDFCNGVPLSQITVPASSHGTNVGGIVAAIKENNNGIAGIAGKDLAVAGSGAKINSYKIIRNDVSIALVSDIAYAIHWGASDAGTYGGGLEIQNHSWAIKQGATYYNPNVTINQQHIALLKDAVRLAWQNECVFVAGRGNSSSTGALYPSCYSDSWVISVGASGDDGDYKASGSNGLPAGFGSSYGRNMDVIAPGVTGLVYTTGGAPTGYDDICTNILSDYTCAAGTSVSAPHVTGAAALILSEQNSSIPHHFSNLTGEDIENLIQITADHSKGTNPTDYDDRSGWGLLRMDELMPIIKAPEYRVMHFLGVDPDQKNISLESSNVTINILEQYGTFSPGYYIADKYSCTVSFQDDITPAVLINSWPRFSGAYGFSGVTNEIYDDSYNNHASLVMSFSQVTSLFSFYFYYIKFAQGSATPINKWIPHDTVKTFTPYSYWVYDSTWAGTSIQEYDLGQMHIFPVPSSDIVTVEFLGTNPEKITLELLSVEGKAVLTRPVFVPNGKGTVQVDVSQLSKGIYFLRADFGTYMRTKKIIVQ